MRLKYKKSANFTRVLRDIKNSFSDTESTVNDNNNSSKADSIQATTSVNELDFSAFFTSTGTVSSTLKKQVSTSSENRQVDGKPRKVGKDQRNSQNPCTHQRERENQTHGHNERNRRSESHGLCRPRAAGRTRTDNPRTRRWISVEEVLHTDRGGPDNSKTNRSHERSIK